MIVSQERGEWDQDMLQKGFNFMYGLFLKKNKLSKVSTHGRILEFNIGGLQGQGWDVRIHFGILLIFLWI